MFKHILVSRRAPLILFAKSFHTLVQTMSTVSELDLTKQKYNAEKEKKSSLIRNVRIVGRKRKVR